MNIGIGYDAMSGGTTTGDNNIAIGVSAGDALTSGKLNTIMGSPSAGGALTTGIKNVFLGGYAGSTTTDVDDVVAIGYNACASNLTSDADGTVAIGRNAAATLTSGIGNVAIGYNALVSEDDGDYNTAVGHQALTAQTGITGTVANTALGYHAGENVTSGRYSTFVGAFSGDEHQTGNHVTAVGYSSLSAQNGDKTGTTAIGAQALHQNVSAATTDYSVAVGAEAGTNQTTGYQNTFLGGNTTGNGTGAVNQIVIGYAAAGHGDNIAVIGNTSMTAWHPADDNGVALGSASYRFSDVFAVQTTTGGIFETGLKTDKIGDNLTGTIVVWQEDKLIPCDKSEDELVMGVIKNGKDEPIVLGAEPVLVTGKVNVGDYIVTSDKLGHGKSVKRGYLLKKDLFGKVIAQALEKSDDSESCLIKCMIRKM